MRFFDTVPISGLRKTADGYLVGEAPVARSGIQVYAGDEVGRPDLDVVRVYRPPEEVFAADSLRSYAHRPVTSRHPPERVTADNWRRYSVGQTGDGVLRDGELVRVPLVLMDAAAIAEHGAGVRELSMGYDADLEFTDGVSPEGEPFDAIQRKLRMNHLALVPRARGGDRLRLGDDETEKGGTIMPDSNLKTRTVTVDGLAVETTDAGAQAIERLQADVGRVRQELSDAQAAHKAALDAKDQALAAKDAELEKLKAEVVDQAALDAKVQARADLLNTAGRIAALDYSGKSDAEVRAMAVRHVLGDAALEGKGDAYVQARFDILAEDAASGSPDPFVASAVPRGGQPPVGSTRDASHGYDGYVDSIRNAWRTGAVANKAEG